MSIIKFSSYAFGCRVNQAEKQNMDNSLLNLGFETEYVNPDIHIINTCAVTAKAEREVRQYIYHYKRLNPRTKIILTGCSATYWSKNKLYTGLPVELTITNQNKDKLLGMVLKLLGLKLSGFRKKGMVMDKFTGSGRAMLKIQDGCHRFCTYCIVPYLRGLPKSERINQIVEEIINLEKQGIKEVILTAINTEAFGQDTGENLVDLIKTVLADTRIQRVSFGSIHPWSLTDDFIEYYKSIKNEPRLVHFFHVPLQSGSDKILKLMKRGYAVKDINDNLTQISNINPYAMIATDIIAGFLGETEADFQDTYDFLEKSPINKFHVFPFSVRNNTAAFYLQKQHKDLPLKVKKERVNRLIALGKTKFDTFMRKNVGRRSTTLILTEKKNGFSTGLFDNQLPVSIDKNDLKPGDIVETEVRNYNKTSLYLKAKC